MSDANGPEVKCDTCGHVERQNGNGEPTNETGHEARAGKPVSEFGDSHIMWPTGR